MKVFVFGTLKKGFPLHKEGLGEAKYLGEYRTVDRYPLVVAGPWFAPMMLNHRGLGLKVRGELYEVTDAQLEGLDRLESIGKPGNLRIVVAVESIAWNSVDHAFAFLKAEELAMPRHSDFLEDYQDRRFVPPVKRPRHREKY